MFEDVLEALKAQLNKLVDEYKSLRGNKIETAPPAPEVVPAPVVEAKPEPPKEEQPAPKVEAPATKTGGLSGSVGQGGKNLEADVRRVQGLLKLAETGVCDAALVKAIAKMQLETVKMAKPDGRIDPGGRSWRALTGETPASSSTSNSATTTPPSSGKMQLGSAIEKGIPAGFARPKQKEVSKEMGDAAVYYLKFFCKTYAPAERKAHYGEFVRFTTSDGREVLAHFEEHTVYGADLNKKQVPHPSIGLFVRKN